jgi:hypothetical protein
MKKPNNRVIATRPVKAFCMSGISFKNKLTWIKTKLIDRVGNLHKMLIATAVVDPPKDWSKANSV